MTKIAVAPRIESVRKKIGHARSRAVGISAAAVAVGAGVAAAALTGESKRSESSERDRPARKSSLKKTKERSDSPAETQQERMARMVAQRVRSTPSPVYEHDDYSTFFMPKEIAEHVKEHNEASAHRDDPDTEEPQVMEIIPGMRKKKKASTFDEFLYRPFGFGADDDPDAHPWPVPALGLVEPTPPQSRTSTPRSLSPAPPEKEIEQPKEYERTRDKPKDTNVEGEVGEPLERRESRVKWGDDDINVYEVITPEYERTDFISPTGEPGERRTRPCFVTGGITETESTLQEQA